MPEDTDYISFVTRAQVEAEGRQEWRVANKLKLEYSEQNGQPADTIYIMQPVLSGFEMNEPNHPKAHAVLEEEFDDIFIPVEEPSA